MKKLLVEEKLENSLVVLKLWKNFWSKKIPGHFDFRHFLPKIPKYPPYFLIQKKKKVRFGSIKTCCFMLSVSVWFWLCIKSFIWWEFGIFREPYCFRLMPECSRLPWRLSGSFCLKIICPRVKSSAFCAESLRWRWSIWRLAGIFCNFYTAFISPSS